jgi:acyl carrier protein
MENVTENPAPADQDAGASLQRSLASADAGEREQLLRETIRTQASTILNTSITDESSFLENGLNSLTALELTKTLMTLTGIEIPMVAIVEHPTPAELAGHLAEQLPDTSGE